MSATGEAAMAIFAPTRRLFRYALDLMHRKPLTIDAEDFGLPVSTVTDRRYNNSGRKKWGRV